MKDSLKNYYEKLEEKLGWTKPYVECTSIEYFDDEKLYNEFVTIIYASVNYDMFIKDLHKLFRVKATPESLEKYVHVLEGRFKGREDNPGQTINISVWRRSYSNIRIINREISCYHVLGITKSLPALLSPHDPPKITLYDENVLGIESIFGNDANLRALAQDCINVVHRYNCERQRDFWKGFYKS